MKGYTWCDSCGEKRVLHINGRDVCVRCGAEQEEPFRVGWDESD